MRIKDYLGLWCGKLYLSCPSTPSPFNLWEKCVPSQTDLLFYLAPHLISSYHGNQSSRLILHLCSLSSDSFHPPCPNHKSQPFRSLLLTQPSCPVSLPSILLWHFLFCFFLPFLLMWAFCLCADVSYEFRVTDINTILLLIPFDCHRLPPNSFLLKK